MVVPVTALSAVSYCEVRVMTLNNNNNNNNNSDNGTTQLFNRAALQLATFFKRVRTSE